MTKSTINKAEILEAAKKWFREIIAINHIKNTKKLSKISEFNLNPFLVSYIAQFLTGKTDAEGIAKALVYPRVLGTSITTSFGQNLQTFTAEIKNAIGSTTSGIDIEFIDQIDGCKKYCQLKAGPNTINKDDIETIHRKFNDVKNLARTNNVKISLDDLVVCVIYGERNELSNHYKSIEKDYHHPVYIGQEFWHRLTGDEGFYFELCQAIAEIAVEFNGKQLLEETIKKLSQSEVIQKLTN